MALQFSTTNPKALLDAFNKRIDQKELKGKITTWSRDGDGDYTHVADEWKRKAWFRPRIVDGALIFNILGTNAGVISVVVYGYYHGHLTETFLNHFDDMFTTAASTANSVPGDSLGG